MRWARRECGVTLRFSPRPGARTVQLAGDFTEWGARPIAMRDDGGDGVFEVRVGPENGLESGRLHGYRVVVDGEHHLDPSASHRRYEGECLNSGLLAPACDAGPEFSRASPG